MIGLLGLAALAAVAMCAASGGSGQGRAAADDSAPREGYPASFKEEAAPLPYGLNTLSDCLEKYLLHSQYQISNGSGIVWYLVSELPGRKIAETQIAVSERGWSWRILFSGAFAAEMPIYAKDGPQGQATANFQVLFDDVMRYELTVMKELGGYLSEHGHEGAPRLPEALASARRAAFRASAGYFREHPEELIVLLRVCGGLSLVLDDDYRQMLERVLKEAAVSPESRLPGAAGLVRQGFLRNHFPAQAEEWLRQVRSGAIKVRRIKDGTIDGILIESAPVRFFLVTDGLPPRLAVDFAEIVDNPGRCLNIYLTKPAWAILSANFRIVAERIIAFSALSIYVFVETVKGWAFNEALKCQREFTPGYQVIGGRLEGIQLAVSFGETEQLLREISFDASGEGGAGRGSGLFCAAALAPLQIEWLFNCLPQFVMGQLSVIGDTLGFGREGVPALILMVIALAAACLVCACAAGVGEGDIAAEAGGDPLEAEVYREAQAFIDAARPGIEAIGALLSEDAWVPERVAETVSAIITQVTIISDALEGIVRPAGGNTLFVLAMEDVFLNNFTVLGGSCSNWKNGGYTDSRYPSKITGGVQRLIANFQAVVFLTEHSLLRHIEEVRPYSGFLDLSLLNRRPEYVLQKWR